MRWVCVIVGGVDPQQGQPSWPLPSGPEFDAYVEERADYLLRYATVVTASPQVAQDVVQSVLERALARWDSIRTMEFVDAYLRRMVVNEFVSLRRRMRWVLLTDRTPEPAGSADHADRLTNRSVLVAGLRTLPPQQRAAVALRYWDGLSDAEIGEQLGCSPGTVRGYILRGLRRLKLQLDEPVAGSGQPVAPARPVSRAPRAADRPKLGTEET